MLDGRRRDLIRPCTLNDQVKILTVALFDRQVDLIVFNFLLLYYNTHTPTHLYKYNNTQ